MLYAADPCPECQTEMIIDDQTGGQVTAIPAHKLGKSFSPYLNNVIIDDNKIEQIKGYTVAGSSRVLQRVDGIYPYYFENGQTYFLVTDSSMVLETTDFRTYTFVAAGLNTGSKLRCKQINNDMVCTNGVDPVFKWNHTSSTTLDGTNGTPNIPKGKYIEQYQEHVWMFNLPSDASGARYSDISSTNGVIINYDNFLAWPADNLVHVGQGDGQIGTAIWLENGQLKLGKERSIYTMFGNGLTGSRYIARPSNPGVGVASNDSVVILDNQSHFVGHDGIYRNEQRISDLIDTKANLIDRSGIKTVSNLWESQSDFARGQFQGSSATVDGLLYANSAATGTEPSGIGYVNPVPPNPGNKSLTSGTSYYGPIRVDFGGRISTSAILITTSVVVEATSNTPGQGDMLKIIIENLYTGASVSTTVEVAASFTKMEVSSQTVFEGWQINRGSFTVKFECAVCGDGRIISFPGPANEFKRVKYFLVPASTGQFISDVATLTSISAWGNFDSDMSNNGGNINYYFRSSTSVINITTQSWQGVTPGTRINAPLINKYFQWASTIQSVNSLTPTSIDNVEIVHIEGAGAVNRAFAIPWRNRYWLSFSTSPDTISSSMLLKSKITNKNPDAWMPISGINIRSFAKDKEETLYGGSSSTGIIYILDSGNNFGGSPIISEYETPSIYFDSLFKEKYIYDHFVTADRYAGGEYTLGVAIDTQPYTNYSYSRTGDGLQNRVIQNIKGHGKLFKWKVTHSEYDQPFIFHNLGVLYRPSMIRKGKDE